MTADPAIKALLTEMELVFDPIIRAGQSGYARRRLLAEMGWDGAVVIDATIEQAIVDVGELVDTVVQLAGGNLNDFGQLLDAIEAVGNLITAIETISEAAENGTLAALANPQVVGELAEDLFALLICTYLIRYHPWAYLASIALSIIDPAAPPRTRLALPNGAVVREPVRRFAILPQNIPRLLEDPVSHLKQFHFNGRVDRAGSQVFGDRFLAEVAAVLALHGYDARYGFPTELAQQLSLDPGDDFLERMLAIGMRFHAMAGETQLAAELNLAGGVLGDDEGGPAVVLAPSGDVDIAQPVGSWTLTLGFSAATGGVAIGPSGIVAAPVAGGPQGRIEIEAKSAPTDGPAFLFGPAEGTRLELGAVSIGGGISLDGSRATFDLLLTLTDAQIVVAASDGDSFLKKVLPPDGIETRFDLGVGWSNDRGLYFEGGAGLEVTVPVHVSILGIVNVDSIYLALLADLPSQALTCVVAATGGVKLGPIAATVERMGLMARVTFPGKGGNLGPANIDKFGFKPPDGAGLAIAAGPVRGGGYLSHDPDKGQYAGVLQISFKAISLTAVGLLTTKMPDGSEGFSLLVIITAEFPPIQLGSGFTLNGAGGLLGVNRTAKVDVLRAGIKNRTLDSILFPKDPVRNAPQILSDLGAVFPPVANRYVFGPMAIIGWGTPTLLKIELGIVLELPSPVRLIIMGRLTLVLPEERAAVAILKMDVLGIIDFDKGDASVDATIYDSRIGQFTVTGDMAMRANWAASPTFALSAGGFNPRFTPPPNFPALGRITIALATGDNPRVRLDAYLALTSNTVQVGASLDVYASVDLGKILGRWSAQAYLGFDTLLRFTPFEFIADMRAGVAILHNGKPKFSAALILTLTGPEPWHAWGYAEFEFFGKRQIPFDIRFGADQPPRELPTADVRPQLVEALKKSGNWSAQLPVGGDGLVALGPTRLTGVLAHPFGRLTVRQTVVPLGVEIAKFGNAVPQNERRFDVTVEVNGQEPTPTPGDVREYFARGQFFELSDDEKLSSPSFELWKAGVSFDVAGIVHPDGKNVEFGYEDRVVDEEDKITLRPLNTYVLEQEVMNQLVAVSAAGLAPRTETGAAQYAGAKLGIALEPKTYVQADTFTLEAVGDGALSYTEAQQAGTQPGVQVVESYEAVLA